MYSAVSDVTRTGEWSPVCQECWWDEGDGPVVGAHFTGRNVLPERTWETRSEVVAAERRRRADVEALRQALAAVEGLSDAEAERLLADTANEGH